MSNKANPNLLIEVDGGVDKNNSKDLIKAGANVLVQVQLFLIMVI